MFSSIFVAPVIWVIMSFCYALGRLPRRGVRWLGAGLGRLLWAFGFRKKIVRTNLALALGREKTPAELDALARANFRSIGCTFLEIARNFSLSKDALRAELKITPEQKAYLDSLAERGRGAIFVSAHLANWELLAMGMAAHGYPVGAVVKRMSAGVSQALVERQRLRTGLEVIYSGGTIEKMKAALARGRFIGFMVDQNITGKKGIRANFFGVPAASIRGLAGLVRDTGTAVVPICAFREADGTHRVHLLPELPYLRAEGGSEADVGLREEWLNTQQYQTAAEQLIRLHPEQWLWIHRRWKCRRDPLDEATAHLENRN